MKKVLLAVVGIMFAATSFAQNALVASLSSGEDVTYYYGVTALQQAVTAAKSGDIINLSGGSFYATNLTKGITIRGAGIDSPEPTYIVNEFLIDIPGDDANRFMMEGIRCTNTMKFKGVYANPYFLKCQFNNIGRWDYEVTVSNIMFANCKITGELRAAASSTYILVNCFVDNLYKQDNAAVTATNCVLIRGSNDFSVYNGHFFNCIFVSKDGDGYYAMPDISQATNCIAVNFPSSFDLFKDLSVKDNCPSASKSYTDVFETFTGVYSDTEDFKLNEAGKAILGTDGKEIGLYGGLQPYNSTPTYPLISTMTVPAKTNDQGKMDVTVGISLPTE